MKSIPLLLVAFSLIVTTALLAPAKGQDYYTTRPVQVEVVPTAESAMMDHFYKSIWEDRPSSSRGSSESVADIERENRAIERQIRLLDQQNKALERKQELEKQRTQREVQPQEPISRTSSIQSIAEPTSSTQEPKGDILGATKGAEAFPGRFTCVCTTNFTVADMTFHQGDVVFTQKDQNGAIYAAFGSDKYYIPTLYIRLE